MNKNDYLSQAQDNVLALYDPEYTSRRTLLDRIVLEFTKNDILWNMGCSFSLFMRGIVDDFSDFDILVANDDVEKAKEILRNVIGATLVATGPSPKGDFNSDDYSHWQINNCDIDLIAGFRIETFGSSLYVPTRKEIIEVIDNLEYLPYPIPVIRLEPLYLLYAMMQERQPYRRKKRKDIEAYFATEKPDREMLEYFLKSDSHSSVAEWIKRKVVANDFFQ